MGKPFEEQSRIAHLEHVVTILDEAVRSTASDPCSYEDAMDVRHRPTPCDCRPCRARAYVRATQEWRYIGAHDPRVRGIHNPREIKMRDAWKRAMGDRELAMLLYDGAYNNDGTPRDLLSVPSARDWYVATSVVQWLATNVGMAMLHEAGFKYTQEAEDRVVLDLNYRNYMYEDPKEAEPATDLELKALLVFARAPYQLPRVHKSIVKIVAELAQRRAGALSVADVENLERCVDMIEPEAPFAFERTSVIRKILEANGTAQSGQGEIYRTIVDDGRKMRRELYAARERVAEVEKKVAQANADRDSARAHYERMLHERNDANHRADGLNGQNTNLSAECERLRVELAGTEGARKANASLAEKLRDERDQLVRDLAVANARADQYLSTMETLEAAIAPRAAECERLRTRVESLDAFERRHGLTLTDIEHSDMRWYSASEIDAKTAECERLSAECARLKDWRDNISNVIKTAPEFAHGSWGGDKEGWGYHFEIVAYVYRERTQLNDRISEICEARDKAINIARRFTLPAQIGESASQELNAELDSLATAGRAKPPTT